MPEKLLILGGTMEAYELAECLVEQYSPEQLTVISSLAGVTANPKLPAGEVRIGGFTDTYSTGGKPGRNSKLGLQKYLLQEKISLLVNATHPYATQISENARAVATELGLPYFRLTRPPWVKHSHDQWIEVPDLSAAIAYLNSGFLKTNSGLSKQIIFLTTGNRGIELFQQCRKCYFVVRTVELPESVESGSSNSAWENVTYLKARGPFSLENEISLLQQHGINLLITKNSGGDSTYAKIVAARKLKIPVLMVARPEMNSADQCWKVNQVMDWIVQNKSE
ncbi:MAG: cobalt-precorrin-6A reductase [SAR324 cluster bacterium]